MHFSLVDRVLEVTDDKVITVKLVSSAEEYLGDHFPGFPVLPGVMMLESMVQAARVLHERRALCVRPVLGSVRALKYGKFVRPGDLLRVEVSLLKALPDGSAEFKGEGRALRADKPDATAGSETATEPAAVAGRFTLRPMRLG